MQECGGCTLCCKTTNVTYMNAPHGKYCEYCVPNVGCLIHDKRPEPCRIFQCVWSQMEKVHIDLRPDNCKVVFEKINDELILGTIDRSINDASPLIHRQIKSFGKEGISVVLQQLKPFRFIGYLVKNANKDEIVMALEEKANDSAKLY